MPGISYEYRLTQELLSGISATDVTAAARALLADDSRVVLAVAPRKEGVPVLSDTELASALGEAERSAVTAWNDALLGEHFRMRDAVAPNRKKISVETRLAASGAGDGRPAPTA